MKKSRQNMTCLRKIVAICVLLFMLGGISGCSITLPWHPNSTPLKTVELQDMGGYTIVYPLAYEQYIAEELQLLCDALEDLSGTEISLAPDTQEKTGKEIVIVGSSRHTPFDDELHTLNDKMDYVIATDGRDIVLGGLYHYADIRAIYDFLRNYIGYNIESAEFSQPTKKIAGCTKVEYTEPEFSTVAVNFYADAIENENDVKNIVDAGFNCVIVEESKYNEEQMKKFVKWCALHDLNIIFRGMSLVDVYYDCPIVKGHCIINEVYGEEAYRYYSDLCDRYIDTYSDFGWKPYVNILGQFDIVSEITQSEEYFTSAQIVSFYYKMWETQIKDDHLQLYEMVAKAAKKQNKEYWAFIDAMKDSDVDVEKTFRWMAYMGLCFGAKGIQYFNYAATDSVNDENYADNIVSSDYEKTESWDAAKKVNEEILSFIDAYNKYEYHSTCVVGNRSRYPYADISYESVELAEKVSFASFNTTAYLVGYMEGDGGYAFTVLDIETPSSAEYKPDVETISVSIVGSKVTCYHNGEVEVLKPNKNGRYNIPISNSQGVFVTVEE